jgi:hypothetical protein
MERFSYWATLLALPFVGLLAKELIDRFRMRAVVGLTLAAAASCALAVAWSSYKPSDAMELKVDSVAAWLNRDGHDRYRYIALGFGNKIAPWRGTDASGVDGSVRPHVARTDRARRRFAERVQVFRKVVSLSAMLHHADRYGLKWVLYATHMEPLMVFVCRLASPRSNHQRGARMTSHLPPSQHRKWRRCSGFLWGILPIGSSILAMLFR